jgi:hypothetical protein
VRAFLDRRNYMLTLSGFQLVLHSGSTVLGKNSMVMDTVPTFADVNNTSGGKRKDWRLAHPYVRAHLARITWVTVTPNGASYEAVSAPHAAAPGMVSVIGVSPRAQV